MSYSKVIKNSLTLKCPQCAKGRIFQSHIKLVPAKSCTSCGLNLAKFDVGDSPAYFSIFTVGMLIPILAVTVEGLYMPPFWLHAVIWLPATILFCYLTLIYVRSIFIHLEHNYGSTDK